MAKSAAKSSLKRQVVGGMGWSAFARLSSQVLQFGITVILARILSPDEFGLIGMIAVFVGFVSLFSELGLTSALVQRDDITEAHLSSVFWLNLAAGVAITLGFIAVSPLISAFYQEPQLTLLATFIAFNFTISAFNDVQTAMLQRKMDFRRLGIISITSVIVGGAVAVIMAMSGFGVWSLVAQMLVKMLVEVLIMWATTAWKPHFLFEWQAIRDLIGFSLPYLGTQSLNYLIRNVDNLLVGRFVSSYSLGLYRQAYTLMTLPVNQSTNIISTVMFPAFSRIQDDKVRIKTILMRLQRVIALVSMPMMAGLFVVANTFVPVVFGPAWVEMVPILQVLCIAGFKQPVGSTTGIIYTSQGRTDIQFRWALFSSIFTIISFFIGIRWGVLGVAMAYTIRSYLVWYPGMSIPSRLIDMTFMEFINNIASIITISLVMAALVYGLGLILPSTWEPVATLVVQVAAGVIIYTALIVGFRVTAYQDLLKTVREILNRKRS